MNDTDYEEFYCNEDTVDYKDFYCEDCGQSWCECAENEILEESSE